MKRLILLSVLLLAGCGGNAQDSQHVALLKKGCVLESRGVIEKGYGRYGNVYDIEGSTYACPAYKATVRD